AFAHAARADLSESLPAEVCAWTVAVVAAMTTITTPVRRTTAREGQKLRTVLSRVAGLLRGRQFNKGRTLPPHPPPAPRLHQTVVPPKETAARGVPSGNRSGSCPGCRRDTGEAGPALRGTSPWGRPGRSGTSRR